ncbi:hypothetical protein ABZY34_03460 [Streptomyces virginiae]
MMLRYALQTVRDRKAGFLGAFVALLWATALVTARGTLLAMGLVLALTAISVVHPLAMSTAERFRECAVLRPAGAKRRQVLWMLGPRPWRCF